MSHDEKAFSVDMLVRHLEQRAIIRAVESYAVLVIMLALLGLAAWVFIHAKEITANETTQDTQTLLSKLNAKRDEAVAKIRTQIKDLHPLFERFGEIRFSEQQSNPAKFHINLTNESGILRDYKELTEELINDIKRTGYNFIDYQVRIKDLSIPSIRVRVSQSRTATYSGDATWPKQDLSAKVTQLTPVIHEFDLAESAVSQVIASEKNHEVQGLLGKSSDGVPTALSTPFLIQLNVTRFGTITLVAIALGILSPLYRFSARLSAYYQARADALRLHQIAYHQINITRLMDAFTPQIDFAPNQSSAEKVSELVKLLAPEPKQESKTS